MTYEAPGVQSSAVAGVTTETFNSFGTGQYSSLETAFGTLSTSASLAIVAADSYGGAGGTGNYMAFGAESGSGNPVTLTFKGPESYFGFWWSAADANNSVTFYSGSSALASSTKRAPSASQVLATPTTATLTTGATLESHSRTSISAAPTEPRSRQSCSQITTRRGPDSRPTTSASVPCGSLRPSLSAVWARPCVRWPSGGDGVVTDGRLVRGPLDSTSAVSLCRRIT